MEPIGHGPEMNIIANSKANKQHQETLINKTHQTPRNVSRAYLAKTQLKCLMAKPIYDDYVFAIPTSPESTPISPKSPEKPTISGPTSRCILGADDCQKLK